MAPAGGDRAYGDGGAQRGGRKAARVHDLHILSRLDGKGLLRRRREGRTDYYRPAHTREQYAELRAQAEVEALVDQFGDVALSHFARQMAQLDPERRLALERLVRKRA